MDQGLVALVVLITKMAESMSLHADQHTLLALPRSRPEAGRTGRAATSARSSAMLAMSPTVVASPARTGACGTETGTADDTHGAKEEKGGLISAPGRLIRASPSQTAQHYSRNFQNIAPHRLQDRSRLLREVRLQASWQAFGLSVSGPSASECSDCSVRRGGTSHHDTRSKILSAAVHERLTLAVPQDATFTNSFL